MAKISVLNQDISIALVREEGYISLTDIAKHRNADDSRFIIQNWMRTRFTVEFLGIWECLKNPGFNRVEFEAVKTMPAVMLMTLLAGDARMKLRGDKP